MSGRVALTCGPAGERVRSSGSRRTVLVGKDAFLKKNAAAVRAMLQDLTASMQFYLERPREARQLLIDARMVRVLPDVYMNMQDYYRDPTLRVDAEALERMQAFQIKPGFQSKNADVRSTAPTFSSSSSPSPPRPPPSPSSSCRPGMAAPTCRLAPPSKAPTSPP